MATSLKLTAADRELRFPVFPEETPAPRLSMDEYYEFVQALLRLQFPRSPSVLSTPDPGLNPVRFQLD